MANTVVVHKGRTTIITVAMGMDVSDDTITSEIRSDPDQAAPLICEWEVAFATDGTDGELVLTIDDLISSQIKATAGFMDIKRVSGGEPLPVFDKPLEVTFRGSVTE